MAQLFCAPLNKIAEAVITSDEERDEYIATWYDESGGIIHQMKFTNVNSKDEFKERIKLHNEVNKPVVTAADLSEKKAAMDSIIEGL